MIYLTTILIFLIFLSDRRPHSTIINHHARLLQVKIKYYSRYSDTFEVDVVDNIMYISKYNKAVHNRREYLFSIFHEFGHLIDYAYQEYYSQGKARPLNNKSIYQDEVAAWKIAKILLEDCNEYDAMSFNKLKNRCLNDYKKDLKL